MSTEVQALAQRVVAVTTAYRRGAAVESETIEGGMEVVTIDAYDPAPTGDGLVDVHFLLVKVTDGDPDRSRDVLDAALAAGRGEFTSMTERELADGPSYITLGAWLGDPEVALRFIALGAHHGWWTALTPATLGITDPERAEPLARAGYVMPAPALLVTAMKSAGMARQ